MFREVIIPQIKEKAQTIPDFFDSLKAQIILGFFFIFMDEAIIYLFTALDSIHARGAC